MYESALLENTVQYAQYKRNKPTTDAPGLHIWWSQCGAVVAGYFVRSCPVVLLNITILVCSGVGRETGHYSGHHIEKKIRTVRLALINPCWIQILAWYEVQTVLAGQALCTSSNWRAVHVNLGTAVL